MIDIDINGEKAHVLIDTGSDISLVNYEYYTKMGSPKLCSNNISLSGIDEVVVYPKGYFRYELSIDGFLIAANLYVLKSLAYDMLMGYDAISKLNLAIDENGIKIVGKRRNV